MSDEAQEPVLSVDAERVQKAAIEALQAVLFQCLVGQGSLIAASALMNLLYHCAEVSDSAGQALILEKLRVMQAMLESVDAPKH